ncbi:MAG TPA: hypothetical protein VFW25_12155 [Silvibacterium sp.]|nr:hypothetical protein [Silvibacterium sp.]
MNMFYDHSGQNRYRCEVVQDLLVPELKALRTEMKLRDENTQQAIRHLSEKFDFAID